MAAANPKPALRPYLPDDAPLCVAIFRASIEELTGDDYDTAQQDAWASTADDETAFAERLASRLTLIGTLGGAPVGFISLEGKDHIDMLYVHPGAVGQGVGATLCDAIEKLAAARGATTLIVDASDTARDFFARRGFVPEKRNTISLAGEWLANTTMKKPLSSDGPRS